MWNAFPASDVGTATSANNFFREIGALPDRVQDTVVLAEQQALTPVFRYLVPLLALGLVLAFLLPEKKPAGGDGHDQHHDSAAASSTVAGRNRVPRPAAGSTPRGASEWAVRRSPADLRP